MSKSKPLTETIQGMREKQRKSGVTPDTVYIRGVTLQALKKEHYPSEDTIFGMRIVVKPDNQMPDGVELIVADKMSIYPPLEEL